MCINTYDKAILYCILCMLKSLNKFWMLLVRDQSFFDFAQLFSSESRQTNQLCSISQCDSNSLLNEVKVFFFRLYASLVVADYTSLYILRSSFYPYSMLVSFLMLKINSKLSFGCKIFTFFHRGASCLSFLILVLGFPVLLVTLSFVGFLPTIGDQVAV